MRMGRVLLEAWASLRMCRVLLEACPGLRMCRILLQPAARARAWKPISTIGQQVQTFQVQFQSHQKAAVAKPQVLLGDRRLAPAAAVLVFSMLLLDRSLLLDRWLAPT